MKTRFIDAKITQADGSIVFQKNNFEIPEFWSDTAGTIMASKYAMDSENSALEIIDRVVKQIVDWGIEKGYFESPFDFIGHGEDADWYKFSEDLKDILINQRASFNSPVWFNCGSDTKVNQMSACQPYDAIINTKDGIFKIGDIVKNKRLGLETTIGGKIVNIKENGEKEVIRLVTCSGLYIDVTKDHLVYRNPTVKNEKIKDSKFIEAGELKEGDNLLGFFEKEKFDDTNRNRTEESEAYLAGWLQADGFVGDKNTKIKTKYKSLTLEGMAVTEDELSSYIYHFNTVFPKERFHLTETKTEHGTKIYRLRSHGEGFRHFVEKWGLLKRRLEMEVPDFLFDSKNEETIKSYLRAWFQADGYSSLNEKSLVVGIGVISPKITFGINLLLQRLGIFSRLLIGKEKRSNRKNLHIVKINVRSEIIKFSKEIGFVCSKKQQKLDRSLKEVNTKGRTVNGNKRLKIKKIESLGVLPVYDIQTEKGYYTSNGILIHNCFILPVEDTIESILNHYKVEGLIFRGGSGAGVNVSKLRGKGEKLSNKGSSSGALSFMKGWDSNAGTIKSGGKQRRAAKLVCMNDDHPDLMEFIECKKLEEDKAKILIQSGIPAEEAYATVAYQNTNHSVQVTDKFMNAVENDEMWVLKGRKDPSVNKELPAREIFNKIAEIAWYCGDPGLQFADRMNRDNPVPSLGRIETTNPCFTGDTRIYTPDGLIPIKELCERALNTGELQQVFTKDGEISTPVAYMSTGLNDIIKVSLSDGREIKCTPNHKWYINGEKVETKDLKIGMPVDIFSGAEIPKVKSVNGELTLRRNLHVKKEINEYRVKNGKMITNSKFPTVMTPEFAEILGHLTGDGWLSNSKCHYSVGWIFGKQGDEEELLYTRYKNTLDSYLPVLASTNSNGCRTFRYSSGTVMNYFVDLGFSRVRAENKRAPEFLFRSDNEIIANYLRGYFGADGTVYGKTEEYSCAINCTSVSFKLLQDIQLLLDVFGIRSYIKLAKKAGTVKFKNQKTYNTHDTYRLSIDSNDLFKFQDLIGFSVKYKNEKLSSLLQNRKGHKRNLIRTVVISEICPMPEKEITYNLTEPKNNLVYAQGVLIAQCGELVAVNNSSCNLSSLNLVKYFDGVQGINWELFTDDINILITAMDIICGSADYPTEEIKEMTLKTRPLGLGFTNLGAFLMMCGLPYASQEARDLTGKITKYMTKTAYCQSVALAKKLGPFPAFEENKEKCAEVLCNVAVSGMFTDRFNEFGLRNSQVTLLAPCGTISILMDCDSFGVEPLFALKSFKRLSGGGSLEFEPNCVKFAKEKFGDSVTNLYQTANELSWKDHIDMLATCQNHLSGGISKTVNMRNDSTIEDIKEAYMYAWKSGCKGITVYRDGSKDLQPLTDISKEKKETFINHSHIVTSIIDHPPLRIKPPKTHKSITHVADIAGHRFRIIAGMYPDGSMCELFISMSKEGSTLSGIMNGLSRSVSLGLQYGVPLKAICDQFMGMSFEPAGITTTEEIPIAKSILDYIGRWLESEFLLKEFDEDEDEDSEFSGLEEIKPEKKVKVNQKIWESENISEFDGPPCLNCGSMTLRSGSCYVCTQCATTTGCS